MIPQDAKTERSVMKRDLKDMIVAISGASAGIGRELAIQLAGAGAKLSLCARRVERLEELNQQLGGGHLCVRADVTQTSDCDAFVAATLQRFGRIDTLVCNAGYGFYRFTHEFTSKEMRDIFNANVFGTTDLIHAAMPTMLKQPQRDNWRGQVMLVSSSAARRSVPYLGPYSATKAAQLSLGETMRVELRPQRIAVTTVHPIMTKTEFGTVAEKSSGMRLPRPHGVGQTVEHVCRRMVRAIEKPTAEVWPHRLTRWGIVGAVALPRLADLVTAKYLKMVADENR